MIVCRFFFGISNGFFAVVADEVGEMEEAVAEAEKGAASSPKSGHALDEDS